ncbi:hypothetical protein Nhal_2867 [Nitrosococcus halophilus Nc 4]|uniref:Uncharacterized protein n=1 Tax=Nitrosococcus halophilus (strain Nc4) TaxID=472759 RepID=D5BY21_NITHN|nr:CsiV family protein [Nitrosococcus halophilus]ADE15932.1 hypothetical protein Nhal_2867 [Nitrosococcus halophilus Nc 4]
MKYLSSYLSLLFLTFLATEILGAPTTWYEVEILIFEHLPPKTRVSGTGLSNPAPLDLSRALKLPSTGTQTLTEEGTSLFPLPSRTWKLTGIEQRLHQSSRYRNLLHRSWNQPATFPQGARPVYLRLPASELSSRRGETIPETEPTSSPREYPGPQLEGTATLSQGRFLQISLDLRYRHSSKATLPGAEEEASQPPPPGRYFRLTESRRIHIQELHYFDHPLLGVLVQVRPGNAPHADNLSTPKTFPLEATAVQEMLPDEAGKAIKPGE